MLNLLLLKTLTDFLPPGFSWGDPLTPEVLQQILAAQQAYRERGALR